MAKITLTDIAAGYVLVTTVNANNALIETALENTLSRDGTSPNTMSANLDMNSNRVVNVTDAVNNQDAITFAQLNAAVLTPITGLQGLADVTSAAVTNRFVLVADGSAYVGRALVEADISDLQTYLTAETNNLSVAVTWANVPNANVTESSVTQHVAAIDHDSLLNFASNEHFTEASISIPSSQISDFPATISQAEAEAGIATTDRIFTALRVAQAIAALETNTPGRNGAKVYDVSAQTISNTVSTAVLFDSEAYDTNGFHEGVTNPSRITIPSGVTWIKLKAQVHWDNNASAERSVRIRKNGGDGAVDDAMTTYQPWFEMTANVGAHDWHQQVETGIINVASTDYFEVVVRQASGGNLDLIASQSWFQIEVIE